MCSHLHLNAFKVVLTIEIFGKMDKIKNSIESILDVWLERNHPQMKH